MLHTLPRFQPDPRWRARTKRRLLLAYDLWYGGMTAVRHWALFVSQAADATEVADAIVARGHDWRPLMVAPERMVEAVRAIQPALVVVDRRLPRPERLLKELRASTKITAVTDAELLHSAA